MAVVLGVIGVGVHGPFFLLIIGAVVLVADLVCAAQRVRLARRKHRSAR